MAPVFLDQVAELVAKTAGQNSHAHGLLHDITSQIAIARGELCIRVYLNKLRTPLQAPISGSFDRAHIDVVTRSAALSKRSKRSADRSSAKGTG